MKKEAAYSDEIRTLVSSVDGRAHAKTWIIPSATGSKVVHSQPGPDLYNK